MYQLSVLPIQRITLLSFLRMKANLIMALAYIIQFACPVLSLASSLGVGCGVLVRGGVQSLLHVWCADREVLYVSVEQSPWGAADCPHWRGGLISEVLWF